MTIADGRPLGSALGGAAMHDALRDAASEATSDATSDAVQLAMAQTDVARLASLLTARTPVMASPSVAARQAAVAAILRVTHRPELLFIKRADWQRDPWSGHVAFPGGRQEPQDATLRDTVIRETLEELDLDLTAGALLGCLDDLAPRSSALPSISIRPFVAVVAPDVRLTPSMEVADSFWIPLSWLRTAESRMEHVVGPSGAETRFPAYSVNGHVLWGLTERIVSQMLSLLDP